MKTHPLENDCDDPGESWAGLIVLVILALLAGVVCMILDGATDGWHYLFRRARR
jgi:hypothetical protein